MKLIDKDKVVAEIERIKKEECSTDSYEGRCKLLWFEQFLSFLNTLEVKEVDLEKEIETHLKERLDVDKVWDFITANVYEYGKVKFVDNGATFDFRTLPSLYNLKQAKE